MSRFSGCGEVRLARSEASWVVGFSLLLMFLCAVVFVFCVLYKRRVWCDDAPKLSLALLLLLFLFLVVYIRNLEEIRPVCVTVQIINPFLLVSLSFEAGKIFLTC